MLTAGGLAAAPAAAQTTLTRVSVDSVGAQANDASFGESFSADGRYVAFASFASNLVPNDTNGSSDVFVKDRQTGTVTRVSVKSDGTEMPGDSQSPSMSANGRFVAFVSKVVPVTPCPGLAGGSTACNDIYVHDLMTGETTFVTVTTDAMPSNGESGSPSISADGRYVVFASMATNLVANDTNQLSDIFVRDRLANTTTRVSVSTAGVQSVGASYKPVMSDDGNVIAFVSGTTTLDTAPDTLPCVAGQTSCARLYIRNMSAGTTSRAAIIEPMADRRPQASAGVVGFNQQGPAISRDGKTIVFELYTPHGPPALATEANPSSWDLIVYNIATRHQRLIETTESGVASYTFGFYFGPSLDAAGHTLAYCALPSVGSAAGVLKVRDFVTGLTSSQPISTDYSLATAMSSDGTLLAFDSRDATLVSDDTNDRSDVFLLDRDTDHDGIPSDWETLFGLDPNNPADAALDSDGDGKTNLQEYLAGTDPTGTFKRYLAEGASNGFFSTYIQMFNPADSVATVELHYLGDSGAVGSTVLKVPSKQTLTVANPADAPDASFSTVIESDQILAVERTMTWANAGLGAAYGSSAETAITNPSTTWYFAEGATHGGFDLFYLLQNPNDTDATVTITYLLPAGQAPIVLTYPLAANSRRTIWVDLEPGLSATDVSAKIDSTLPIFAERSMYLSDPSTPGKPFSGGTSGAGIAAPATQWFVAEGATGGFFDLYILIGNPSPQDANVTVTYLLPDGTSFDKVYPVAAQSRLTIGVDGEDPRLAGTSVSAVVTSTNSVPVVVERAMWWPSPNWYEGSLTAATTESGPRWALAGGFVDSSRPEDETYLLVANPSDTAANVTFSLVGVLDTSTATCQKSVRVEAHSRYTTGIKGLCDTLANVGAVTVGGTVTSDGPAIVVERSTYWSTADQFWAAGASTLLTKLP